MGLVIGMAFGVIIGVAWEVGMWMWMSGGVSGGKQSWINDSFRNVRGIGGIREQPGESVK